jgi:PIN domain nuclease of toxin-antitoxin system
MSERSNDIYVSVASSWEMAIKVGLGKWPEARSLIENFESELATETFQMLPILVPHVRLAGFLTSPHKDPFDRLLVAQAIEEGLILVTSDAKLTGMGAPVLW